mgnify:CR=1 FL=1
MPGILQRSAHGLRIRAACNATNFVRCERGGIAVVFALSLIVSIPLGVLSATRPHTLADNAVTVLALMVFHLYELRKDLSAFFAKGLLHDKAMAGHIGSAFVLNMPAER